jgi:hypothetical protein
VAGLLDVEDVEDAEDAEDAEARRYRLPDAHAEALLDADNPAHAGATAYWMGSLAEVLHRVPGVYRSGEGLPYPEYGADCRLASANFNRPDVRERPGRLVRDCARAPGPPAPCWAATGS